MVAREMVAYSLNIINKLQKTMQKMATTSTSTKVYNKWLLSKLARE